MAERITERRVKVNHCGQLVLEEHCPRHHQLGSQSVEWCKTCADWRWFRHGMVVARSPQAVLAGGIVVSVVTHTRCVYVTPCPTCGCEGDCGRER